MTDINLQIEALFRLFQRGDKTVQNQIIEILRERFMIIAKRRVLDRDIEDIVQESLLVVAQKMERVSSEISFEKWAYKILRNKVGNYFNSSKLHKMKNEQYAVRLQELNLYNINLDPDFKMHLTKCMKKMVQYNKRYARVINLIHKGYKTEEICQRMDISRNSLFVLTHRGRKMLLECLKEGGYCEVL